MHSHHNHREHQVAHRRVHKILEESASGSDKHFHGGGFSKVTSKSAAVSHASKVHGHKGAKRYAKGGGVAHKGKGHTTNIAIVMPHKGAGTGAPMAGAAPDGAAPMGGPPGMPPPGAGGPPGMPPPGMPPMHNRGGRTCNKAKGGEVHDGESTKANLSEWKARAKGNSYFRGGAATGIGREEKAAHQKRKK